MPLVKRADHAVAFVGPGGYAPGAGYVTVVDRGDSFAPGTFDVPVPGGTPVPPSPQGPVRLTVMARAGFDGLGGFDWSYAAVYLCDGRDGSGVNLAFEAGVDQAFAPGDVIACEVNAADHNDLVDAVAALASAWGGRSVRSGPAPPSAGAWARGDLVWSAAPSAGGDVGWVCVAAGTPGVWKAFGGIDP
jgi:hypothetical protein